ncbi:MAG: LysM peptidoglycan-binding domain-containing protein [Oligoflexia bacterium]|nr:LysM peptidoglycan-binding domain-containing protein [Oligoflexia bacterium]
MTRYLLLVLPIFLISCSTFKRGGSLSSEDKVIQNLPGGDSTSMVEMGQIPIEVNAKVEQWIQYFQGRGRPHFERYLERSTRYTPLMKKILKENGVPEDLIYVCMIESGFSSRIKSRAKAVGFWQFIKGTGNNYGLRVSNMIDERYDPVRSTEAASAYFKGLYNLFNSWFLALASYNVGENRIKNLVMKNYTRDFWEIARRKQLPSETVHYIPKFLAASLIAKEPEKYGFVGLDYQAPMVFDVVTAKDPVDMKVLAKSLKIDYKELKDLNPAYKTQYAPLLDGESFVRVPQGLGEAAKIAINDALVKNKRFLATSSVPAAKGSFLKYKVQRGDNLSKIAERFDVTVDEILKLNRIRKNKLRPGTMIKIPSSTANIVKEASDTSALKKKSSLLHIVKRGETLIHIARKYGVSLSKLARANDLNTRSYVYYGQKLWLPK